MNVQIIDNISQNMASILSSAIRESEDVRVAVAFISQSGLDAIRSSIETNLRAGGHIEFLVGLDMYITEPRALRTIYDLSHKNTNVAVYCHASFSPETIYHPKLYLFRTSDRVTSIIGSSNLTIGGLKKNVEVNVLIQASAQDGIVSDAYDTYNQLKFHQHRVVPDEEFLVLYEQVYESRKEQQRRTRRHKSSGRLVETLKEKVDSMQRPIPTHRDLVGWLGMVYAFLPDGEFTNQEVYAHESVFQQRYPDNRNIKAKIRQQLQLLRDLGFIEHLDQARWRKLRKA